MTQEKLKRAYLLQREIENYKKAEGCRTLLDIQQYYWKQVPLDVKKKIIRSIKDLMKIEREKLEKELEAL